MQIEDAQVARFAALFDGRRDAYGAFRTPEGGEYSRKEPLTLGHYSRHLNNGASLGVYPVRDDGTASWGCTDIDMATNIEGAFATALVVATRLNDAGLSAWVERSKGKGYHVWTFHPEGTRAAAVRRTHKDAARSAGIPDAEVFPKQDTAAGGYGNFVNLPYPGGAMPKDKRVMVDLGGEVIPLGWFLANAKQQSIQDAAPAAVAPPKRELPVLGRRDSGPRPACMEAIIRESGDDALFAGQRNEALIRLASYEVGTAQNPEAWHVVYGAGARMGLDDQEIGHVYQMAERQGYVYGCDRKREIRACADACTHEACRFDPGYQRPDYDIDAVLDGEPEGGDEGEPEPGSDIHASTYDEDAAVLRGGSGWCLDVARHFAESRGVALPVAFWAAVCCAAAAVGDHVHIAGLDGLRTYPNLWVCLLGPSGNGKSSGAKSVIELTGIPQTKRLWESGSLESWMTSLAADPARFMYQDELALLLSGFKMRGMEKSKMTFASLFQTGTEPIGHQTIGRGEIVVEQPALTILGCSTTEWFQDAVTSTDFMGGLMARWLLVPLESPYVIGNHPPADPDVEARLKLWAKDLQTRVRGEMILRDELRVKINAWFVARKATYEREGKEAQGYVQRLGLFATKLAMVLHLTSQPLDTFGFNHLVIGDDAVDRALLLLDWLTPRTIAFIGTGVANSDFEKKCQSVLGRVKKSKGKQLAWYKLRQAYGWEPRIIDAVVATLQEQRRVVVEESRTGKAGRPARYVRAL